MYRAFFLIWSALAVHAPPAFATPPSSSWGWRYIGPISAGGFVDVVINPSNTSEVAALSSEGTLWLSHTSGRSWNPVHVGLSVFGGTSNDETVTRSVQAHFDDLAADVGEVDIEDGDSIEDFIAQTQELGNDLQADLATQGDYVTQSSDTVNHHQSLNRVFWTRRGLLLADDAGLLLSRDDGSTWSRVLDKPVFSLIFSEESGWIAGTSDGIRTSGDLRSWSDRNDFTEGVLIYDLVVSGGALVAGSSAGLLRQQEDGTWEALAFRMDPVLSVVSGSDSLIFSDIRGVHSAAPAVSFPHTPLGLRGLTLLKNGWIVGVNDHGVWQTFDIGHHWRPLNVGLNEGPAFALAASNDVLLLASDQGLYSFEEHAAVRFGQDSSDIIPLDLLLRTVDTRFMAGEQRSTLKARRLYSAIPRVRVISRYTPNKQHKWADYSGTIDANTRNLYIEARLEWVPDGRKQDIDGVDLAEADWLSEDRVQPQFIQTQNGLMVDNGRDQSLLLGKVSRRGSELSAALRAEIGRYYYQYAALILQRPALNNRPLIYQVAHELQIEELYATMDFLTDGRLGKQPRLDPME